MQKRNLKNLLFPQPVETAKPEVLSLLTAEDRKVNFLQTKTSKLLIIANVAMALIYFLAIAFFIRVGFRPLFYLLIAGEVFHLWQILTYAFTVWSIDYRPGCDVNFLPPVDIFITVAGESVEIVEATARAAMKIDYPNFRIFILNDGFVAKKDNWHDIQNLAARLGVGCITRKIPGGAKAGNLNNALRLTGSEFIAVFDADQAPYPGFLKTIMPYFGDSKMGFVQSPQFYNNSELNEVTKGAWEQQEVFFGPVCRGKNRLNATFMCGTNMVIRSAALLEAGGMSEDNVAEDFLTSLFIHQLGWKSVYVPVVLAEGLAPEDFLSYYKQQSRWARGSLEILFRHNPLFKRGLTFAQKIQYLASASFYFSGFAVFLDLILPLIYFFTGRVPLQLSSMALAAVFLPYIFLTIGLLRLTTNFTLTFRAVAFSMSSWTIHIKAILSALTGAKTKFEITAKRALSGNYLYLTIPHILYLLLTVSGAAIAVSREGLSAAFFNNLSWALFNCVIFMMFISAALPEKKRGPAPFKGAGNAMAISISKLQNRESI